MSCGEIKDLLDVYVMGELQTGDLSRVEGHLSGCPGCSREVQTLRRLAAALRGCQVPPVPDGFCQRVFSRLDDGSAPSPAPSPTVIRSPAAGGRPARSEGDKTTSVGGGSMLPRHECPNCQFTLGANAAKCDYCRMYRLGESSGTARSIPARCAAAVALAMLVVGALGQWPLTSWRSPAPTPSARALLSPGHDSQSVLVRKLAAPSWSPLQATGEPDTLNGGDVHTAWASQETDAGREWLELEYDPPIRADHVRIYESFNPGAVIALILRDANGKAMRSVTVFDTVRQGPSVTEVTLPLDPEPVRFVKVILDTARVPGWNEIDAVELLGPDARGWAVDAKASTYYKFESWSRRTRPDLPVLPPPPSWPSYRDIPSWSPLQATGAPDTLIAGDHGTAWASLETDKGLEWLELGYKPAIRATQVRIRETFNPGAVTGMTLLDEQGVELAQLTVSNTCREAPVFLEVPFPLTKRPVARVKIVLDTAKVPGWNEIDAVELVGPDARGWAVDAKASSSFADRWNVDDRSRAPHGQ